MTCPVCCVARRDFDLIEAEKPAAFRPLSRTPAQLFYFFYLPIRLCCAVAAALFAEGLLSGTSDSIVNLANGGFACDILYHIIGVCLSSFECRPATPSVAAVLTPDFFPWQVNIAVVRWGFCADYVVKFASPSCVRFIFFGFLLPPTTCVWVWMVCFLHSVTTGSRDRANVSFIIIIIII